MAKLIRYLDGEIERENETDETVVLTTEEGEKLLFELLDVVTYMGKDYVVLGDVDGEDEDVLIVRQEYDGEDKEVFSEIEDEYELNSVFAVFKEENKDYYNFKDGNSDTGSNAPVSGKRKYRSRLALVLMAGFFGWWGAHLSWLGYKEDAKAFKNEAGGIFGVFNLNSWAFVFGNYIAIIFGKFREDANGNPVRYFSHLRNLFAKKK